MVSSHLNSSWMFELAVKKQVAKNECIMIILSDHGRVGAVKSHCKLILSSEAGPQDSRLELC